ncbi:MAG TPA: hypothetical protein K8V79_00560 [Acinetobacter lwoffii]|uniref:Pilus assembly protein PilX n=1 Tax=Acinetobacter lwoffii TaxID=28090 RepID=A0A9D2UQ68_ACILW|nr:hypothetical protein [Acinetobacter lwoffii]
MKSGRIQQGATLIVVLIILLLVTILGTYAMNQGLVNLRIATASQVQKLLMQSSDVALSKLEKNFRDNEASNLAGTPVGQVLLTGNEGLELQFCFKPSEITGNNSLTNSRFFNLSQFRLVRRTSITANTGVTVESGNANQGICDPATMFAIGRKAVVTQVALSNPNDPAVDLEKYELSTSGTDLKEADADTKRIRVIVTSLSPAMASGVSTAQIKACLKDRMMDDTALQNQADANSSRVAIETPAQCLNALGVPVNTQVSEYVIRLEQSKSALP